jgi:hypothetical protein
MTDNQQVIEALAKTADPQAGDVVLSALKATIPEILGIVLKHTTVLYGIRTEDEALVFQFFPKDQEAGWSEAWDPDVCLTPVIESMMETTRVSADYVPELNSFCVIYGGGGLMPAPLAFASEFLRRVEKSLPA